MGRVQITILINEGKVTLLSASMSSPLLGGPTEGESPLDFYALWDSRMVAEDCFPPVATDDVPVMHFYLLHAAQSQPSSAGLSSHVSVAWEIHGSEESEQ